MLDYYSTRAIASYKRTRVELQIKSMAEYLLKKKTTTIDLL
jgi:hypothetical protein